LHNAGYLIAIVSNQNGVEYGHVTLEDAELMEMADRIVAELEIEHFFNIQLVGGQVIEINPRIHPKLSDLIMQCVEVDANDRPPDMKWVADRLNLIEGILRARSMPMNARADADAEDESSPAA
jgi:hypothetical protein